LKDAQISNENFGRVKKPTNVLKDVEDSIKVNFDSSLRKAKLKVGDKLILLFEKLNIWSTVNCFDF
jgi:hypothetical protein